MSIIAKKLRLQPGQPIIVLHRPAHHYFAEFTVSEKVPQQPVELLILFVKDIEQLQKEVMQLLEMQVLLPEGRLLIAYPKKGNKVVESYIHRDDIFPALGVDTDGYIKNSDYKFNQMVKLDDVYTIVGLKRVKRDFAKKSLRQPVVDYSQYISQLEKVLRNEPEALHFWQTLTQGYQKNWARYVYGAKQQVTQEKRLQEMIVLLKQKVKVKR